MSSSFSANQYDSAFKSHRLQNWCETSAKHFKERPAAHEGHTTFVANDRGHLLPGVAKSGSAWPDYKGTWDLPARIPARHINPTARSAHGLSRLQSWGLDRQHTSRSPPQRGSKNTEEDVGLKINEGTSGPEITASQNKESQSAAIGSIDHPAEDKQATGASRNDRPPSQCPVTEEKPTPRAAAEEGTNTDAGEVRPASNVSEKAASKRARSCSK
ncbi:protein Flattop isoform X2 [Betta splendens]|uniref:Protein Flattop n=1 Tax=Betta splendens TaxID=158456 RepID=A0A6P7N0E2_BETSP|nr:protein Flattop isoform X2 [Betta splendens]XP_029012888.1 protein Flattop isoform X2 [Betta splendens]XP_040927510.1 protein Flattop isoform X2 [Betta splendens]